VLEEWYTKINIYIVGERGCRLFARTRIPKGTWLGQYTGLLRPIDENLPDSERDYLMHISIGKLQDDEAGNKGTQRECWLDGREHGSFLRFASHSCDPNTEVIQRQNKGQDRVIAFRTIRDIVRDEAITVSYGDKCFVGKMRSCSRCRSTVCSRRRIT
jgi:SET domain-containing protein